MKFLDKITKPNLITVVFLTASFWLSLIFLSLRVGSEILRLLPLGGVGLFLVIGLFAKARGFKVANGIFSSMIFTGFLYSALNGGVDRVGQSWTQINFSIDWFLAVFALFASIYTAYFTLVNKQFAIVYKNKEDVSIVQKNIFRISLVVFIIAIAVLTLHDFQVLGIF